MKLLVYSSSAFDLKRFQKKIEPLDTASEAVVCRTLDALLQQLRQPQNNFPVAVLNMSSEDELDEILSIRDLLTDIRIVLILPDSQPTTILKGHTLCPRFLTCRDGGYEDVKAVLFKMLTNRAAIWQ